MACEQRPLSVYLRVELKVSRWQEGVWQPDHFLVTPMPDMWGPPQVQGGVGGLPGAAAVLGGLAPGRVGGRCAAGAQRETANARAGGRARGAWLPLEGPPGVWVWVQGISGFAGAP